MHAHPSRRLSRWPGVAVGVAALAASASLVAGPATAALQPSQTPVPHVNHLLATPGAVAFRRAFDSDEADAVSAGTDGVPITVGESALLDGTPWFVQPLAQRWTGAKWSVLPSVFPGGSTASLGAISTLSADDAWAAGQFESASSTHTALVERWDGKKWSLVPSGGGPEGMGLEAVSAISDTDVWVAGYSNPDGTGVIQHWDGTQWTESDGPEPGMYVDSLDALSDTNVWAVGLDWSTYMPVVKHWDGSSWQDVSFSLPAGALGSNIYGVGGTDADDLWAAGFYVDSSGEVHSMIQHWDGSAWDIVQDAKGNDCWLNGVGAANANDAWAVGRCAGTGGATTVTLVEHWDGVKWSRVRSQNVKDATDNDLNSVSVISSDDAWATGETEYSPGEVSVLLEHWNGSKWHIVKGRDPNPEAAPTPITTPGAGHLKVAPSDRFPGNASGSGTGVCFSNLENDSPLGLGVNSQKYESDYAAYDDQAAADVTLTKSCKVRSITVLGTGPGGLGACNLIRSEVVTLFADESGHPGEMISRQTAIGTVIDERCGSFDIPLKTVVLKPGTYWVSVQANLDMSSGLRWTWDESTQQSGAPDVWRAEGGAYGLCRHWQTAEACTLADNADLTLQLSTRRTS